MNGSDEKIAKGDDLPVRRRHSHAMPGVDIALTDWPGLEEQRALVQSEQLQTPALRLRLLRSALRVLRRWDEKIRSDAGLAGGFGGGGAGNGAANGGGFGAVGACQGAHVRAALGDVCVGYAGEARRLLQVPTSAQGAAEALAEEFDALGKRLLG